jgi:membrane-associated phospholipid phosphatase
VDLSNIADSQETDMGFFLQHGIDWIIAIQSLGGWLELPMKFFTLLGYENFFFLGLPLIYWSVDADLGMRVALVLAVSNNAKPIFKLLFAAPRPYWLSGQVKPFLYESSFGIPSGHAQDAVALWGSWRPV